MPVPIFKEGQYDYSKFKKGLNNMDFKSAFEQQFGNTPQWGNFSEYQKGVTRDLSNRTPESMTAEERQRALAENPNRNDVRTYLSENQSDGTGDFSSNYDAFKASQPAGTDYSSIEEKLRADEAARRDAMIKLIQGQTAEQRNVANRFAEKRESGVEAGLGITQGLNYSSFGQAELDQVGKDLKDELNRINQAEAEAIANASTSGLEALNTQLANLRAEKLANEQNTLNLFNTLVSQRLAEKQENRLEAADEQTKKNQDRDDARTVIDSIISQWSGTSFEDLPQAVAQQITDFETASGYPTGYVKSALEATLNLPDTDEPVTRTIGNTLLQWNADTQTWDVMFKGTPSSGTGNTNPIDEESQIIVNGEVIGFRRLMKDGSVVLTDKFGQPSSFNIPSNAEYRKIGTQGSTDDLLSNLRSQFGLGGTPVQPTVSPTTPVKKTTQPTGTIDPFNPFSPL